MQADGDDGHQDEGDGAGQVEQGDLGGHALVAQDVGPAHTEHGIGDDGLQVEGGHAGQHQQQAAQHIGQPGHGLAHVFLVLGGGAGFDGAGPFSIPGILVVEVPHAVGRHAETLLRQPDQGAEAQQAADHGRQFGAHQPGQDQVRHQEAGRRHEAVLPRAEAFHPGLVLAEEAGHEAQHEDGQDDAHGEMHEGDIFADGLVGHGRVGKVHGLHGHGFNGFEALQHGGAHSAEGHGHAVEGQADDGRAQGREAKAQQQGRRQGGRRAEAGGAFDEGGEHEADDDGLQAFVGADLLHAGLDGLHGAAVLQGIVDQQRAEHDDQHAHSRDGTFDGKGHQAQRILTPEGTGQHHTGEPGDGHGPGGGPAQAGHEDQGNQDRDEGKKCQKTDGHETSSASVHVEHDPAAYFRTTRSRDLPKTGGMRHAA